MRRTRRTRGWSAARAGNWKLVGAWGSGMRICSWGRLTARVTRERVPLGMRRRARRDACPASGVTREFVRCSAGLGSEVARAPPRRLHQTRQAEELLRQGASSFRYLSPSLGVCPDVGPGQAPARQRALTVN